MKYLINHACSNNKDAYTPTMTPPSVNKLVKFEMSV